MDEDTVIEETPLTPVQKLDALLKAENGEDKDADEDNEFDSKFMGKMQKYMGTAEGKKKYSCRKADDGGGEYLSKADELLEQGYDEMEQTRRVEADAGQGEQEQGYFIDLSGSKLFKAMEEMAANLVRNNVLLEKLSATQETASALAKAVAEVLHDNASSREKLNKAEGEQAEAVHGVRHDPSMAPSESAGLATRAEYKKNCETLMKAEGLDSSKKMDLLSQYEYVRGNITALPDELREQIEQVINKGAV